MCVCVCVSVSMCVHACVCVCDNIPQYQGVVMYSMKNIPSVNMCGREGVKVGIKIQLYS